MGFAGDRTPVARGFIPVGLRSSPKTIQLGLSGKIRLQGLALLRSPAGTNTLQRFAANIK